MTTSTATLSAESVQDFLTQIESQLFNSDTYHQVLNALQTKLGEVADEFQTLLTALSREAIQCTLQQFMGNATGAEPQAESTQETAQTLPPQPLETQGEPLSDRHALLLQLGQTLKQKREAKGLTQQQLYTQTYVPLHHLKALEQGQLDKLPEDIYIRGFVRRLGNALGLNGVELAESIPSSEQAKRVVPSWQQKKAQLSPVHLYVGYAALMAGAVGGLTWISQPAQPEAQPAKPKAHAGFIPAQLMHQAEQLASANVAPPETLPVR